MQVSIYRLKFDAQQPIEMKLLRHEPLFDLRAVRHLEFDQHLSFLHVQQNSRCPNLSGCVDLPDKFGGSLAGQTGQRVLREIAGHSNSDSAGMSVESKYTAILTFGNACRGQTHFGFRGFSPFTQPSVVAVAEGIPFIALTNYDVERLYQLKGDIVSRGVKAVTGFDMPVFSKRRFQHGAVSKDTLRSKLPFREAEYRQKFLSLYP